MPYMTPLDPLTAGIPMNLSREELRLEISRAFENVDPPAPDEIAVENDWDAECIDSDFSPYLTESPPCELLYEHASSLAALTPRAFLFFLKDYLRCAMLDQDSDLGDTLIYRLSAANLDEPYWRERLSLFSSSQRLVVVKYAAYTLKRLRVCDVYLAELLRDIEIFWSSDWGALYETSRQS
jgi:hypothetical protein